MSFKHSAALNVQSLCSQFHSPSTAVRQERPEFVLQAYAPVGYDSGAVLGDEAVAAVGYLGPLVCHSEVEDIVVGAEAASQSSLAQLVRFAGELPAQAVDGL